MGPTYNPLGLAGFTSSAGSYAYDPLLSDGDDVVSRKGQFILEVAAPDGPVVKRGTICWFNNTTGDITPGSGMNICILAEDCDTTGADTKPVQGLFYVSGKFKADAIIWPAGSNHLQVAEACRDFGILIESVEWRDGSTVKTAATEKEAANARAIIDKNRAARKEAETEAAKPRTDATDSPWAYLTPEEREKHPELANLPMSADLKHELGLDEGKTDQKAADKAQGQQSGQQEPHKEAAKNDPHAQHQQHPAGHNKPPEKGNK